MRKRETPASVGLSEAVFKERLPEFEKAFRRFVRTSNTGLENTLFAFWKRMLDLRIPFLFDADADMAKFTFGFAGGFHICTSTRRFHRPKKTGKPASVTIVMGGFKEEYDDPEQQLIPCDKARKIDCCYFGMAEDQVDLAMFFIDQLLARPIERPKGWSIHQKAHITRRKKKKENPEWNSRQSRSKNRR